MPRNFVNNQWPELAELAKQPGTDIRALQEILVELLYRRDKKAILSLRLEIVERLNRSRSKYFRWPSTAKMSAAQALDSNVFWDGDGLLKFMGYHVGLNGASEKARREVLDFVFSETVPRIKSQEYMEEWGQPGEAKRLKKLAHCLASFCRNAKGNPQGDMSVAIEEWEADLNYLKQTYYSGRFDFSDFHWPTL